MKFDIWCNTAEKYELNSSGDKYLLAEMVKMVENSIIFSLFLSIYS